MSRPLQERRSGRDHEPRRLFTDGQAYGRFHAADRAQIAQAVQRSLPTAEPSDSDEHDMPSEASSASENDAKAAPNDENVGPWATELHDVHPPGCSAVATVTLPHDRPATQLG